MALGNRDVMHARTASESDATTWQLHMYIQDGPKNWGAQQIYMFLAHFNAVLFWTHLSILSPSKLSNKVAPPSES